MNKILLSYLVFNTISAVGVNNALAASFGCDYQNKVVDSQYLAATYQIQTTKNNGKKEKHSLFFARKNNQIIYTQNNISEMWELTSNGKIKLFKYFDQFQKGIEYQPNEIAHNKPNSWNDKKQIIGDVMLASMPIVEQKEKDCKIYTSLKRTSDLAEKIESAKLQTLSKYELPEKFQYNSPQIKITWKLVKFESGKQRVAGYFKRFDSYELFDYTDIGDNESEPFLQKMINLGFIAHSNSSYYASEKGIYSVSGSRAGSSHGHQH